MKHPAQRGVISGTKSSKWPVLVVSVPQEVIQGQYCLMPLSMVWVPAAVLPSACLQEKLLICKLMQAACTMLEGRAALLGDLDGSRSWAHSKLQWFNKGKHKSWLLGRVPLCHRQGQEATQQPWGSQLDWEAPSNLNYSAVSCLYGCSCFKR